MKLKEIKGKITCYLREKRVEDYDILDIYKIIAHVLKLDLNTLILLNSSDGNKVIEEKKLKEILNIVDLIYLKNEPLQYVLNEAYFYNEKYVLDGKVLIPRQDSEILVEEAIKLINKNNFKSMLDMCTGSGCIGISISKNSSISEVLMIDISQEAVEVAKKNVKINNAKKCKVLLSDLFSSLNNEKKFDIIVSNPPYIKTSFIDLLDENVKKEPHISLDGGEDGLVFYRKILNDAKYYLNDNGYILFEIGYDQAEDIKKIISEFKFYDIIGIVKDYQRNDRVVICRFHLK